ncbi:MAG: UMP kinase [Erysipelotrichaceae bacterium]|nr:UMP kinase [Erysipelotrichaceae bacterium]
MRVLIKFSGEALKSGDKVFDSAMLNALALQVKNITDNNIGVGIVIGGGNVVRGKEFEKVGFNRVEADTIGMVATTLNCMALAGALRNNGVNAEVMSAVEVESVSKVDVKKANELIEKGYVVLFGGGIGNPYFSTDTACALRAIEIHAEKILMAKNGVDGVYDSDPRTNPDAKMYTDVTFDEILDKKLGVMDQTAATLCRDNGVEVFVFNANDENNIVKAATGKIIGTTIK